MNLGEARDVHKYEHRHCSFIAHFYALYLSLERQALVVHTYCMPVAHRFLVLGNPFILLEPIYFPKKEKKS